MAGSDRSCWRGAALLSLTLLVISCGPLPEAPDPEAEEQVLLELDRAWAAAAAGDDIDALVDFWADDGVIYPAGQPAVVGKEAIREFVVASRQIPAFSIGWEPQTAHVSRSGELGYTTGITRMAMAGVDGKLVRRVGKYTVVWRKVDGAWKCAVDMFNFDEPLATAP